MSTTRGTSTLTITKQVSTTTTAVTVNPFGESLGSTTTHYFCLNFAAGLYCGFFMVLDRTQLYFDLYDAFICAKRHKSKKPYVIKFEKNLKKNLLELTDELLERRYKPQSSMCFIVEEPKKREIFAANFRDRIVHHLYYNYTYDLFNSTFIEDSYSCRKGKGTHYGIHRLEKHIRQESENYTKGVYVLKMDIKGYFIHINRLILLKIVNDCLDKMKTHKTSKNDVTWGEKLDYDFVKYLGEVIIMLNPTKNCLIKGDKSDWDDLPDSKSLFKTKPNCGLPIGNLTSQLFSNVYLNVFDQFMKRSLRCKHYGRYVDDFYVVSGNKRFLKDIIGKISIFIKNELGLEIQGKKTHVINIKHGIEFLGGFVKSYRTYLSNKSIKRINRSLYNFQHYGTDKDIENMVNSYLGTFSHWKSNGMKKKCMDKTDRLSRIGRFCGYYEKYVLIAEKC